MTLTVLTLVVLTSPTAEPSKLGECTVSGTLRVEDQDGNPFVPEHAEVYVLTTLPVSPRQSEPELLQQGRQFVPRILVVERHDTVRFINRDKEPHQIHAAQFKNAFMSGTNQMPETFRHTFQEVGESTLGCHIHPRMSGTILTVPNAFHVKVAEDGTWALKGLPKRPLEIVFWQRTGLKSVSEKKTVTPCADQMVNVTLRGGSPLRDTSYGGQIRTD